MKKYGPIDWTVAFLALALCYAAGEVCAWLFGQSATETTLWFRVLERTYYGTFPVGIISFFLIRVLSGKWPWQKSAMVKRISTKL